MKESSMNVMGLWFNEKDENQCYLIPSNKNIPKGNSNLKNINGKTVWANIFEIEEYSCSFQQAQDFLKKNWEIALADAKIAWNQLFEFSKISGQFTNDTELKDSLLGGLGASGGNIDRAFNLGKNISEQFQDVVNKGEPESDEAKQAAFKKLFGNIPDVMKFFEEENLKNAIKDPEAWANGMYEKMFGEEEKIKAGKVKEKLKNDIRESIAENLRKAGVKPSNDFK